MQLTHEFGVHLPPSEAWDVLVDVERIAPCMPGAQLLDVADEEYRGVVKVKLGPITATYKGAASFVERDESTGTVVLRAEGRETRGQGNASAVITATLTADGDGTLVRVVTDLNVTGRVAQFGRGVLADVSAKLLDQFVACLEQTVLASPVAAAPERPAEPTAAGPTAPTGSTHPAPSAARADDRAGAPEEPAPADMLAIGGVPVAKRALPVLGVVAAAWLWRRRRRRRRA